MTVPDESLSIKEIITKYSHGICPDLKIYDEYDDTDDDDFTVSPQNSLGLDLTDIDNLKYECDEIQRRQNQAGSNVPIEDPTIPDESEAKVKDE